MNDIDHKVAPATEVFGKRKQKMLERREKRVARNQNYSKFHHIWNSTIRHQLIGSFNKVLTKFIAELKKCDMKCVTWHATSASALLNELGSDPDDYIWIATIDYYDLDTEIGEELESKDIDFYDYLENYRNSISKAIENLEASKEWKEFHKLCPYIVFDFDDDSGDYLSIYLTTQSKFMEWALKQFSSFDSFISFAMETDSGRAFKATIGAAAGICAVIGIYALAIKFWYVIVAIYGIGALAIAFSSASDRAKLKLDKKNPSPEEAASLEVFERKYYIQMQTDANRLKSAFQSIANELHDVAVKYPSPKVKDDPYSKMFIPTITLKDLNKSKASRGYRSELPTETIEKIADVVDDIDIKSNRKIIVRYIYRGNGEYEIGVAFNWLDSSGIILPNLK